MQKNLVIVESPAKAKTIEKFLGKDFKVMSSYGHIRDLEQKKFSIDVHRNYAVTYVIPDDKKKVVSELKAEAAKAETVWLASDEDREGEAISWHLAEVLKLDTEKAKRIVFHEITKNAILRAIETPRSIDLRLVDAQQARRVLDRIVGFELSPVLWRKIKPALSAGRVQSVAVRLIVEREREIRDFLTEASFRLIATFLLPDGTTLLKAELNRRIKTQEEVREFLQACRDASFKIDDVATRPVKKSPAPPFTTSTLQQEAARKLGYSVSQTMMIAQRLYESGQITYMRTDSVNLSDLALHAAREAITGAYGEKYHKFRKYSTKTKGAQEAHEAIRPTWIANETAGSTAQEKKLYELIRKRTLASQMADAELERTTISAGAPGLKEKFIATGEVITFDGFLQVYHESSDDESEKEQDNGLLPAVKPGDSLSTEEITATERFTQRPPRYTEASLVRRLEELGIGRPSTYAPTIQTIQNREYVIKGDREGAERRYRILTLRKQKITEKEKTETAGADRNKLMPTDTGTVVNDFLMENFPHVMDYNFTASVEKEFDSIAEGEMNWTEAIDRFYKAFHPVVEQAVAVKSEHRAGERQLGADPKTGRPVFVKIGRFGPVIQLGASGAGGKDSGKDEPKPQFASLMKGQSIETITLEEALKLFELPRTVGEFEGKAVVAGVGRFGPYVCHDGKYFTIPKHLSPQAITLEESAGLIAAKRDKEAQRSLKTFDAEPGLAICNGRFGTYISYRKKNYRLNRTADEAKALTLEEALEIIRSADAKAETKKKTTRKK